MSETQVAKGEPIALRIRLRGAAASSQPDLAPLERDFEVLERPAQPAHRHRATACSDESVDWLVELSPRREGELEIPALAVGDAATEPLPDQRDRERAGAGSARRPPERGGAERRGARERRSRAPRSPRRPRASLRARARPAARRSATRAGDVLGGRARCARDPGRGRRADRQGSTHREADRRQALPRHRAQLHACWQRRSGDLEVPPIRFEGRVRVPRPAARAAHGVFGQALLRRFLRERSARRRSARRTSSARAAARSPSNRSRVDAARAAAARSASPDQWWLPAREVALSERWDPAAGLGPRRRADHAAHRAARRRRVAGAAAAAPGARRRGRQAVRRGAEGDRDARGTLRVDETTLIPTQPGTVTLPAIEVAWWDTQADAARTAMLPARTRRGAAGRCGRWGCASGCRRGRRLRPPPRRSRPPPPAAPRAEPRCRDASMRACSPRARVRGCGAVSLLGCRRACSSRRGRAPARRPRRPPTLRSAARALRRACARNDRRGGGGGAARAGPRARSRGRGLAGHALGRGPRRSRARAGNRPAPRRCATRAQARRGRARRSGRRGAGRARRGDRFEPRRALPPLYPAQEPPRG